jgi:hypothetical protein
MTFCAQRMMRTFSNEKPRENPHDPYAKFNICWTCRLKFPKHILFCSKCHNRLRTHSPVNHHGG